MPRRRPQPAPKIRIVKEGRTHVRYRVSCTSCGPVSIQTTAAYADEAAARHLGDRHGELRVAV